MNPKRTGRFVLLTALFAALPVAAAPIVVPGGGPPKKADCYAGFEVDGSNSPTLVGNKPMVSQKSCAGSCTFQVQLCINEPVAGCTAAPVTGFKQSVLTAPATGGSDHLCGAPTTITVPLAGRKKNKKGKKTISVKTTTSGKPKTDKDKLILVCEPNPGDSGCGACGNNSVDGSEQCDGTADTACPGLCLSDCTCSACANKPTCTNPQGGPNSLILTIDGSGDLDTGWTGQSHNFPIVLGSKLNYCLAGCDDTTNPVCTGSGDTGAGTANGQFYGAPLPLVSGGVPVCVVNEFNGPITLSKADLSTGEMEGELDLFSTVWTAPSTNVCPRCAGGSKIGDSGTCNAGPNRNGQCKIEGIITVNSDNPPINHDQYFLSSQCPPGGVAYENVGKLDIRQPVTTEATSKTGAKLCGATQDDACGAGTCGSTCPAAPPLKGGINQFCCSGSGTPCFPTKGGDHTVSRTGMRVVPAPAFPSTVYPKDATTRELAAVFCIAATQSSTINGIAGLPGAGTVIYPLRDAWCK